MFSWLKTFTREELKTAWDCAKDYELARELMLSENRDPRMANLVACVIMDLQLQEYLDLAAKLDWDLTATELSW